jgi:glycosyltransferase involved in cell wall biosynthesis
VTTLRKLRIGFIASPIQTTEQPFAGGMEAHTVALAGSLRERGHEVTIHDGGSGFGGRAGQAHLRLSEVAQGDVSMPARDFMAEHHAYLSLMVSLDEQGYDVVHNNCLHYLPVAMAPSLRTPMLTTLHSPPTPWLESAIAVAGPAANGRWVSVSRANAAAWAHAARPCRVIPNGVALDEWRYRARPRRGGAVWSGRIVPEKGTHLAVEAARLAGLPLTIAGPIDDREYFERCVSAAVASGAEVEYAGHLDSTALSTLVGDSDVALVTPCWEEPFGLVAIEALACGTPVAAFARGALPEILDARTGVLARPEDSADLARQIERARRLSRADCRRRAVRRYSLGAMTDRYLDAYRALGAGRDAMRAPTARDAAWPSAARVPIAGPPA